MREEAWQGGINFPCVIWGSSGVRSFLECGKEYICRARFGRGGKGTGGGEPPGRKAGEEAMSEITTLCYIEQDGKYLMLHRTKKKADINAGKWIGLGGHMEEGESPDDCVVREVFEESGLQLISYKIRGIVTFFQTGGSAEYMFLYTADGISGELADTCVEGELAWVEKERVPMLPVWEGDRIFLKLLLDGEDFFSLKLCYRGDALVQAILNGKETALVPSSDA